jgi:cellulose synthase/poly-beta-1,6-N-acetylglucosamine synthase-like glycosyltransferase
VSETVILLVLFLCLSLIGLTTYLVFLRRAIADMQLSPSKDVILKDTFNFRLPIVSVIIPAYNEADNIQECVMSVLNSTSLSSDNLEVWVVDDQSTDETLTILKRLQQNLNDLRLKIICGLPRPEKQVWTGKNWACAQATERSCGEYLLFIDADVRLKLGAIETVIHKAEIEKTDLLNCIPALVCDSLAEWLVQPLIFINMLIAFNSTVVKNPNTKTAFAAGPFMLFRHSAYNQVGGHCAVASKVAEDVALARLIKHSGLKLQYVLGADLATLRMYRSWGALWEGWTKVLYSGAQRSFWLMLYLALVMLSIYSIPWLGLVILLGKSLLIGCGTFDLFAICLALSAILLQYNLRTLASQALYSSPKYWWLHWLGGLLVAFIAITSVIKTETGWGWTWRGRSLK